MAEILTKIKNLIVLLNYFH